MSELFFRIRNAASKGKTLGRLRDLSLDVRCGECVAVSGHTYSGVKELYSVLTKNSEYLGSIRLLGGKELRDCRSSYEAGALYMDPRVMRSTDHKTLLESLSAISGQGRLLSLVNDSHTASRFKALLEELDYRDCKLYLKDSFSSLSRFEKMQFAVLRCLYASAGCILLENPFQGLREEEIERLIDLLGKAKEHGTTLVYIADEHIEKMERLIDRVVVLRHGIISYVFYPEGTRRLFDYQKIDFAAGGKTEERKGLIMPVKTDCRFQLKLKNSKREFAFSSGDRIGIYDPEMKIPSDYDGFAAYLGVYEITLNGKTLRIRGQKDFLNNSVVLIRKDPARELFRNLSPVENVTILSGRKVNAVFSRRRINRYIYRDVCERYSYLRSCLSVMDRTDCYEINELDMKCLVVAKWLSMNPDIAVFFDLEDTYQPAEQQQSNELLRQLSQEGVLVITVSPNLDFLQKTSDTIIN